MAGGQVLAVDVSARDFVQDYLLRLCIGGIAVSAFAVVSDIVRPKSFAGLFGAAPSIALSTLVLALYRQGPAIMAVEGRSMMVGSLALCLYCVTVCYLMKCRNMRALPATSLGLAGWIATAFGVKWALLGW